MIEDHGTHLVRSGLSQATRDAMDKAAFGPPGPVGRDHVCVNRPAPSALDRQEGGSHYKDLAIQPVEFIHRNGIGFAEGSAIKYLTRWRAKGGVEDLKKARHFIDMLIEMETKK